MRDRIKQKWRPRLSFVVLAVLGIVLILPFAGLFLFSFFANQLVQQTEESLLGQASVLSASFAALYDEADFLAEPVFPSLNLANDTILPPRADARPATQPIGPRYLQIAAVLSRVSSNAQQQTLVGYRMLDINGTVFAGSAEIGQSLAHVPEVATALSGKVTTVARVRLRDQPTPGIYALSRGTRVRVFVAMPVYVGDQVIGAVYLSRTPTHIFRFLSGERLNLIKALGFVVLAAGLIGFVFWRFITGPIHRLIAQTREIGATGNPNVAALTRFGTREIASLGQSFQTMAAELKNRQDAVNTFTAHVTHELKSPLTALRGAAELMQDAGMDKTQRVRFLDNILADTARMEALLGKMRDLARAEQPLPSGTCKLQDLQQVFDRFDGLEIRVETPDHSLPVHCENLQIMVMHLLENAVEHGATQVVLQGKDKFLEITDNGTGISAGNAKNIFTPFFTTRRDTGGTGMGLSIVASMLQTMGGEISLVKVKVGTCFRLEFLS
ncbi:MAG: ATP-binding protein [Rhodobacteraceae bacterium]|nr:ATP-binding protein [Paracoccaceae bacterium]